MLLCLRDGHNCLLSRNDRLRLTGCFRRVRLIFFGLIGSEKSSYPEIPVFDQEHRQGYQQQSQGDDHSPPLPLLVLRKVQPDLVRQRFGLLFNHGLGFLPQR